MLDLMDLDLIKESNSQALICEGKYYAQWYSKVYIYYKILGKWQDSCETILQILLELYNFKNVLKKYKIRVHTKPYTQLICHSKTGVDLSLT